MVIYKFYYQVKNKLHSTIYISKKSKPAIEVAEHLIEQGFLENIKDIKTVMQIN